MRTGFAPELVASLTPCCSVGVAVSSAVPLPLQPLHCGVWVVVPELLDPLPPPLLPEPPPPPEEL